MASGITSHPILLYTLIFITIGKHALAVLIISAIHFAGVTKRRSVYAISISGKQISREIMSSWTIFFDGAVFYALTYFNYIHFRFDFHVMIFIIQYICIFLFFELWFFVTHVALHSRFLSRLHHVHHRSHTINPLSGLQFSLAEKAILTLGSVGFIAAFSQFFEVSIYSILAFYFIYYTNSLIGHSNIEVQPSNFTRGFLHRVFTSPTYHALHHARFNGHYGLTITLFDRLNRSIFPDYVDIHRRVTNGQSLARLSDRLSQ